MPKRKRAAGRQKESTASAEEMALVAAGKMRLPKAEVSLAKILKIRTCKVRGNLAVEALLADRDGR
jgi:hypothetical protein